MLVKPLNVPHYGQLDDGYCLPACVKMVLEYAGLLVKQRQLARDLGVRAPLGAPASNITRLQSDTVDVIFTKGALEDIYSHLARNWPLIVFVQAGELPHWRGQRSQHAIVVVGIDEETVYILDPAASPCVIAISRGDFLLAWSELDYIYALLHTI